MKEFSVYSMGRLIDHVQGVGHVAAMRAVEQKYAADARAAREIAAEVAAERRMGC
jgi:hypothetical protein